jgi:hypothetical protein
MVLSPPGAKQAYQNKEIPAAKNFPRSSAREFLYELFKIKNSDLDYLQI